MFLFIPAQNGHGQMFTSSIWLSRQVSSDLSKFFSKIPKTLKGWSSDDKHCDLNLEIMFSTIITQKLNYRRVFRSTKVVFDVAKSLLNHFWPVKKWSSFSRWSKKSAASPENLKVWSILKLLSQFCKSNNGFRALSFFDFDQSLTKVHNEEHRLVFRLVSSCGTVCNRLRSREGVRRRRSSISWLFGLIG